MPGVSPRLRAVLEARRDGLNARFRRLGRGHAPAAFLGYLARTVDPLVDGAGDGAADAVLLALFDFGLAAMGRGLVGEDAPSALERALVELLPRFAPHWPADPGALLRALGNAFDRLQRAFGEARARWWMETLATAAPSCATRAILLDVGLALAWRAGLAEARSAALRRSLALDPAARTWLFGAPDLDTSAERRFAPPGSTRPLGPLAVVGRVGGFVGFGGPFRVPPRALATADRLFATDGRVVCEVHADAYGARLCATAPAPAGAERAAPKGAATCDAAGRVRWAGQDQLFPELREASSSAAAAAMLAVTVADSHFVWVLGRPEAAAA